MTKIVYSVLFLTLLTPMFMQAQPQVKQINKEVTAQKGSAIHIVSQSRRLNIKSWDQNKVKISLSLAVDSAALAFSDDELFELIGFTVKPFSNRVDIFSGSAHKSFPSTPAKISSMIYADKGFKEVIVHGKPAPKKGFKPDGKFEKSSMVAASIQIMDIMVPAGVKLDVKSEQGDVNIAFNLDEAKLNVVNGTLDAQDFRKLQLTGKYCTVNTGAIGEAEVEFENGTLRAQEISELDIDSKASTIEYEKGKYVYMRSQGDYYTIDAIDKIEGRKLYGGIKLGQLNSSFDLEGNNADIKIRNIGADVTTIKIVNKYADVRLPVKSLKNYFVDFTGYYSSVFAPFEKEVIKEPETKELEQKELAALMHLSDGKKRDAMPIGELAPHRFTGKAGNINDKHTRIQLTCHSCTVDFK
jgi:hypothetical protein